MSEQFTYRTAEEVAAESTHNDNPFGLVYSGAITENVPGKVNIIPISYMMDGLRLVANVYVPASSASAAAADTPSRPRRPTSASRPWPR